MQKLRTNYKNGETFNAKDMNLVTGAINDIIDIVGIKQEVTYSELKSLRDNGELVPGQLYRITDYVATTTQKGARSAGHTFDIIVTALGNSELSEEAKAIEHSGDMYFANCELSAWELKYCLNNDTSRFAWADETNGKGVIYYMKDEWNNKCPYDFKNIKFGRNDFNNSNYPDLCYDNENNTFNFLYKGTLSEMYLEYFYTFALKDLATGNWYDASVAASIGLKEGVSSMVICRDNKIKPTCMIDGVPLNVQRLNGDVFFNVFEDLSNVSTVSDESLTCNCLNNTIEGMGVSFGAMAIGNKISGSEFIFGNNAKNNVKAFSTNSEDKELYYGNDTQNILPPSTNIFTNFWKGTKEEYDAMDRYDSNTLYIIAEE